MDIKDFLHFYLGCEVIFSNEKYLGNPEKLTIEVLQNISYSDLFSDTKPILRPLSDMTEEEYNHTAYCASRETNDYVREAENTRYLLSKHFDLFSLIENGIAIDKSKITTV